MNDHKQELVKTGRKFHFKKKLFPIHLLRFSSQSLCLSLPRFPNNRFKLLTVTSETRKYFIFLDQICSKTDKYRVKNRKSEYHCWILHIWISQSTKSKLKLTILIFWIKFTHKFYFRSKTEEVNIPIKFYIFDLV